MYTSQERDETACTPANQSNVTAVIYTIIRRHPVIYPTLQTTVITIGTLVSRVGTKYLSSPISLSQPMVFAG